MLSPMAMSTASHQTVRLSRGSHSGPDQGACVMELASMLAGERFSDHPACVSPVVAALLRTYNDRVADEWRQTLYGYAAKVVGTRDAEAIERARARVCAGWMREILERDRRLLWWRWRIALEARRVDGLTPQGTGRAAGVLAAMLVRRDGEAGHVRVLALLERLVAMPRAQEPGRRSVIRHSPPACSTVSSSP